MKREYLEGPDGLRKSDSCFARKRVITKGSIVRNTAWQGGKTATFLPKPLIVGFNLRFQDTNQNSA